MPTKSIIANRSPVTWDDVADQWLRILVDHMECVWKRIAVRLEVVTETKWPLLMGMRRPEFLRSEIN
jgi:hypothetical protein